MNTNKITIIGTIIVVILLLVIPTTYKVINNHRNHLYAVVEGKITSMAEKCFFDEKCTGDKITLKELYANGYLTTMSDPVTKEDYNENSYILKDKAKFKFIVVE